MHDTSPERAIVAMVSNNAGNFTVEYLRNGNCCCISRSGYGWEVFDEIRHLHVPVIRFDCASFDNVCKWLHGPVRMIEGYARNDEDVRSYTLQEYLDIVQSFGIPIQYLI